MPGIPSSRSFFGRQLQSRLRVPHAAVWPRQQHQQQAVTVGAIAVPTNPAIAVPVQTHGAGAIAVPNVAYEAHLPFPCPSNGHDDIGDLPEPMRTAVCREWQNSIDVAGLRAEGAYLASDGFVTAGQRLIAKANALESTKTPYGFRARPYSANNR